ncbi:MAG: J domain-containing protein [Ilumatobacteraceae bacterium]
MSDGHYRTLRVSADATASEIRDAYRRLARVHHPDRGDAGDDSMAAINEAYRVLGEPSRRAVYDASRRGSAVGGGHPPAGPAVPAPTVSTVPSTPSRYPWKLVVGMAVVGVAIVLIGAALYEPPGPERPDNLLEPGSCVTILANSDAQEVVCSGGVDDRVVEVVVAFDDRCPVGTEAYRDRQGRGTACVSSVR